MSVSKIKKFSLSVLCAFVMLVYVPLACAVGNSSADDGSVAGAEHSESCEGSECDTEICENCILSEK